MVKQPPALKRKRLLSNRQLKRQSELLGKRGEERAFRYLKKCGYIVLETNVFFPPHEIDIVALDSSTKELVFVEVKTRSTGYFGNPAMAVSYKKLRSLIKAANQYRKQVSWLGTYRFDIIAILPDTIEQYKNITWL